MIDQANPPAPACFESDRQWRAWLECAREAPPGRHSFCADCTPEYQASQIQRGDCAHPTVTFVYQDGEIPSGNRKTGLGEITPCDGRRQHSPGALRVIAIRELGFDPRICKRGAPDGGDE